MNTLAYLLTETLYSSPFFYIYVFCYIMLCNKYTVVEIWPWNGVYSFILQNVLLQIHVHAFYIRILKTDSVW